MTVITNDDTSIISTHAAAKSPNQLKLDNMRPQEVKDEQIPATDEDRVLGPEVTEIWS